VVGEDAHRERVPPRLAGGLVLHLTMHDAVLDAADL
jgi:hypothetical protein